MSQLSGLPEMQSASDQDHHPTQTIPLGKATLLAGLVAAVLAVVVIAGTARNPSQTLHMAAIGHTVDAFSTKIGVDYNGGDLMRVRRVKSARACADICCNTDQKFLLAVKPTAYTWLDDNYNWGDGAPDWCYCKNALVTQPKDLAHAVSGKCTP
mmetsp:Transcript_65828/g.129731  ORF Transcript_65828/g.129731 Transcript_65828/m.129731 type:complete len:154 (+) Transcript_65828:64-525(+)